MEFSLFSLVGALLAETMMPIKNTDIFSSSGGTNIGAMLEGLAQTEQGEALLSKAGLKKPAPESPRT